MFRTWCDRCCLSHYIASSEERINLVLSDSTLHASEFPRDEGVVFNGDSVHLDLESIPGGRCLDLERAYYATFRKCPQPQNILLICGLNDVLSGAGLEDFKQSIRSLHSVVRENDYYHADAPNNFIVCPLLRAPQLYWFSDNTFEKPHGHRTLNQLVDDINSWITLYNQLNGGGNVAPRVDTYGVRYGRYFRRGRAHRMVCHQFSLWRSTEAVRNMLHLSDEVRLRLRGAVARYFLNLQ